MFEYSSTVGMFLSYPGAEEVSLVFCCILVGIYIVYTQYFPYKLTATTTTINRVYLFILYLTFSLLFSFLFSFSHIELNKTLEKTKEQKKKRKTIFLLHLCECVCAELLKILY